MPGTYKRKILALALTLSLLTAVPAGAAYSTLRPGATGQDVRKMQAALTSLGYTVGTDGTYDSVTWAAVLAFQRDQGLRADGLAGNATLTRLYSLAPGGTVPTAAPTAAPAADAVLQQGSSGTAVRTLQNRLKMLGYLPDSNGVFGAATREAVLAFQQDFGLSATGRADQTTLYRLEDAAEGITTTAVVTTAGGTLTLRSSRSTLSTALGYLPNGSTVGVVDPDTSWSLVRWHARQGYVMTDYLSLGDPAPAVTAAPTAGF